MNCVGNIIKNKQGMNEKLNDEKKCNANCVKKKKMCNWFGLFK